MLPETRRKDEESRSRWDSWSRGLTENEVLDDFDGDSPRLELKKYRIHPRGNFHSKTGEPVQGLIFSLINWNFKIGVKQLILL